MTKFETKDPQAEAQQLRDQGLTDDLIMEELTNRGYSADQAATAISQLDYSATAESAEPAAPATAQNYAAPNYSYPAYQQAAPSSPRPVSAEESNIYERIEEIAESMIDEKWDDLIAEVKKIVEWKEKLEDKQAKLQSDVEKLKEDFNILHQGVLGKLEDYDDRMREVGTELGAVGKVFKDVIPEFVENVKELSFVTKGMKREKK